MPVMSAVFRVPGFSFPVAHCLVRLERAPCRFEAWEHCIIDVMSVFREFEKKLEGIFEGVFLRAFRSGVQPVEIGKKLVREAEANKSIGVASRVYVPNRYRVGLSPRDYSRFESYQMVMATELENLIIKYVQDKRYVVFDRPRVSLVEEERLREGEFSISVALDGEPSEEPDIPRTASGIIPRDPGPGPASLEMLDSGTDAPRFELDRDQVLVGRTTSNDIILHDPKVSRVHARFERNGDTYTVVDLDSTNGTWINERRINEAVLSNNDIIRVGTVRLLFRR